ncbi:hypothetical protein [Streptomyces sp. NPDC029674]|uniref:hypothetical protein n=1 Tax=Streptomyces sp. NPDC029674 TaxID=3365297 RepID=UPI00384D50F3
MSTEAPRSPIPPRPTAPPRPASPPPPAAPPAEPPPPPSARFPDVRPPVDKDWLLTTPRPTPEDPDRATRIQSLLAPFDEPRTPHPPAPAATPHQLSDETPPLPSSRLPDAPPKIVADEPHTPPTTDDASPTPSGEPPLSPSRPGAPDEPPTPATAPRARRQSGETSPPPASSARLPDSPPTIAGKARPNLTAEPPTPATGTAAPDTHREASGMAVPPPPSSAPAVPPTVAGEACTVATVEPGAHREVSGVAVPPPPSSARLPDVPPSIAGEARIDAPGEPSTPATGKATPPTHREASLEVSPPVSSARLPDAPPTVAGKARTDLAAEPRAQREAPGMAPPPSSARLPDSPPTVPGKARTDAPAEPSTPAADGAAVPPPSSSARLPDAPPTVPGEARTDVTDEPPTPAASTVAPGTHREAPGAAVPPPPSSARLPDAPPTVPGKARTDVAAEPSAPAAGGDVALSAQREAPSGTVPSPASLTGDVRTGGVAGGRARRAVGAVDLAPGPGAGRPFVFFARPALYDDTTTRLRPVGAWARPRAAAAAACVVLGLGLIGGAVTGSWLTGESAAGGATRSAYTVTGALWHSVPVDRLFPPVLKGEGAGPGGADRAWTRIAVAPDSGCRGAFDPLLKQALDPVGCLRLLRATYTDATRSHVTTVGLLFTKADADAMQTLRNRFTEEGLDRRTDLMPRPYAAKGTAAEGFRDAQRAAWTVSVLPDAPVVAYSVSGFADGRAVTDPEPATEAMGSNTTSAPAQAGLGHEAKGIADRVERGLRKIIAAAEKKS